MSHSSKEEPTEVAKRNAAFLAVDMYVRNGMVIGLGTGSTAKYAVERIGEKLENGDLTSIIAIPTSESTRSQALSLNIPLLTLDENSEIDLAIDGADEVDSSLNLVKGRGGALLREKMIEECAKTFVVIADESKIARQGLGSLGALPVEITKFCAQHTIKKLEKLSTLNDCRFVLRMKDGLPFETENQNFIVDITFKSPMKDPYVVASDLMKVTGVVQHGLFLDLASLCVVGKSNGNVYVLNSGA
ncbi:ribulose 5-phosphate isomerase [Cardiosporidium cionae]|uniref:ribose-5-phosphate isomerase n=1 Tax=Cardiosporidium cionae TaxID=476202 RepID=A0ABQ7JCY5_9APIC|nr:ribulose 5-phosphate isomerase [Cardiosporidium cionae]|eukprot:KAF8821485.1 ribulose 5-phosphate isomerase [Cardiosporidium cionae]